VSPCSIVHYQDTKARHRPCNAPVVARPLRRIQRPANVERLRQFRSALASAAHGGQGEHWPQENPAADCAVYPSPSPAPPPGPGPQHRGDFGSTQVQGRREIIKRRASSRMAFATPGPKRPVQPLNGPATGPGPTLRLGEIGQPRASWCVGAARGIRLTPVIPSGIHALSSTVSNPDMQYSRKEGA